MPEHTQSNLWPARQPVGQRLPILTAVGGTIDAKVLPNVAPGLTILDHRENGIRMVGIQSYRKAELRRQIVLYVYPIFAGITTFVDAAVILLIEHIWIGGVLHYPVN